MLHLTTFTSWVKKHDANYGALRRAARTAVIMPSLFALSIYVFGNEEVAIYTAFGSFALLTFVDFTGPMRNRLQAQATISLIGAVFVCLGTLTSHVVWLSVLSMGVVTLVVIFAGVVSSVLASATTSLLLVFILSTAVPGPFSGIPDRLAGWGLVSVVAFLAVWLLWPVKGQSALRLAAANACRAVAMKLKVDASTRLGAETFSIDERDKTIEAAHVAVDALHRGFLASPLRPTGLSVSSRAVVRLVDELLWLDTQLVETDQTFEATPTFTQVCQIFSSSAAVLETGARLLNDSFTPSAPLTEALHDLRTSLREMESEATRSLPIAAQSNIGPLEDGATMKTERVEELVTSLEPSVRAVELGLSAALIGENIDVAAAGDRRGLLDTLAGRQPGATSGRMASARRRAGAHLERHSVWLHNSVRGAVGLSIAVLIAETIGLQHSYWVILGALSVLRSSAINTGQNALRALLGTTVGFVVGAGVLALVGTNVTLLWFILPLALLVAGFAPTAISFAAGQAGFTLTLVILFNILQPADWQVGLYRIEDVAIGAGVSVGVGLLFWPRGAAAALGAALREAFAQSAAYLVEAVNYVTERRASDPEVMQALDREQTAASAASLRLDDAFRSYLVERNAKPIPLVDVSALVTGVANLRQSADAVLDLWEGDDRRATREHLSARRELLLEVGLLRTWYEQLGGAFVGEATVPEAMAESAAANRRLVEAVQDDLCGADTNGAATAVLLIWTRGYLESVRRVQETLVKPAQVAAPQRS